MMQIYFGKVGHQWSKLGTGPLPQAMLTNCQLDPKAYLSMELERQFIIKPIFGNASSTFTFKFIEAGWCKYVSVNWVIIRWG